MKHIARYRGIDLRNLSMRRDCKIQKLCWTCCGVIGFRMPPNCIWKSLFVSFGFYFVPNMFWRVIENAVRQMTSRLERGICNHQNSLSNKGIMSKIATFSMEQEVGLLDKNTCTYGALVIILNSFQHVMIAWKLPVRHRSIAH